MSEITPEFTRDKWLDGIIWGSGAKSTRKSVSIKVSDLPLTVIELIRKRLETQNYETYDREVPNAITRQVDFTLFAIGTEPVFGSLPSYSSRRLSSAYDEEFINGFLTTRLWAKRKARVNDDQFSLDDIDIVISGGADSNEIIKILLRRNIEFYKSFRSICIKPASYGKEPFSTFVSGLENELKDFSDDIQDEDSILHDIQEGIEEKMARDSSRRILFRPQDDLASAIGVEQDDDQPEEPNDDHEGSEKEIVLLSQPAPESATTSQRVEKMRLRLKSYSYRFSEEILNSRMYLKKGLEKSILDSLDDSSKLTRPNLNELIDAALTKDGWAPQSRLFEDINEDMMRIDYLKDRVQVEVETGHPSFLGIDLLKFQLASPSGLDKADVGIYVVTTESFQKTMINTFGLPWEGSITFEKVIRSLPSFKAVIQVPIYVIGIDV